ncbi:hypothetical protein [uncultured Caulobacter sp.]|uniref:hypothetical protein n=1 Tax=uncultured Caulobacter sp. TaxID=158749 RepID=UPI002626E9DB|nr:hypothetical protein [uncultured Caulobacter sp.]
MEIAEIWGLAPAMNSMASGGPPTTDPKTNPESQSWWEDTNNNGIPDGYFTDVNGNGKIDVGDTVKWSEDAFIYEQIVNEYTADVFYAGFQDWGQDLGWKVGVAGGATLLDVDIPARGGLIVTFSAKMHDLVFDTFGQIDFSVMSRLATDIYAEAFNTYNPYED